MAYTVRYTQSTREQRYAAALQDAREYLGEDAYASTIGVLRELLHEHGWRKYARSYPMVLTFVGLQGVPAQAVAHEAIKSL